MKKLVLLLSIFVSFSCSTTKIYSTHDYKIPPRVSGNFERRWAEFDSLFTTSFLPEGHKYVVRRHVIVLRSYESVHKKLLELLSVYWDVNLEKINETFVEEEN